MFINKVMIYGNLTRDPELNKLPSGTSVVSIGVATNRKYKNQQGELTEDTEFHNVVLFGRLAEITEQYLKKGSGVFIEGRLRTSSWDGDDGKKRYKTEIIAESLQFGPKRNNDSNKEDVVIDNNHSNQPSSSGTINPDDIPF